MAQPRFSNAVAVDHRASAEQTAFSWRVAHVVVESQFFGNFFVSFLEALTRGQASLSSAIDFLLEIVAIPLIASRAKKLDRSSSRTVPHRTGNHKGCKEHGSDTARKYSFDIPHPQGFVKTFRRPHCQVEQTGNYADYARCNVVSHDAARIIRVKAFRAPRRRHWLDVTGQAVGVGHPHSRAKKSRKVKCTEAEAKQAGEK